jgi:hypothetical protein
MRILMKIGLLTEKTNEVAKAGRMGSTIQEILADQKPEAAYFTEIEGVRTAFLIVDLADPSLIPALAEPWFLAFGATVEFHPVMLPEDLERAGAALERAAQKYAA